MKILVLLLMSSVAYAGPFFGFSDTDVTINTVCPAMTTVFATQLDASTDGQHMVVGEVHLKNTSGSSRDITVQLASGGNGCAPSGVFLTYGDSNATYPNLSSNDTGVVYVQAHDQSGPQLYDICACLNANGTVVAKYSRLTSNLLH